MPVRMKNNALEADQLKGPINRKTAARRDRQKAVARVADLTPIGPMPNDLLPGLTVENVSIGELKLPVRLLRQLGDADILEVANSMRAYRVCHPALIGNNNLVIDGVARIKAAERLGLKEYPCVRLEHLSEAEQRAFRIAANRIGANRTYDLPELKLELDELILEQQPIQLLGFTGIELDAILLPEEPAAPEEADEDPVNADDDHPAITRLGDLWQLGEHLLLCGDAKDPASYARLMGEERAQLALTDPPYGVAVGNIVSTKHRDFLEGGGGTSQPDFENLIGASFTEMRDYLVRGGMLMSFMDYKHTADLINIGKALGMEHLNLITWVKPQGGMGGMWRSQSEFVVVLKRPGEHKNRVQLGRYGRDRTNVWQVAGAGTPGTEARKLLKEGHPTPKPVEMLVDAILDVTDRGDIVLDPFAGSGSTLIAAEEAGRRARAIELDPIYCDLVVRRWERKTRQQAVLADSGDRFSVVAEQRSAESEESGDGA
jgi:DNA modification methylase